MTQNKGKLASDSALEAEQKLPEIDAVKAPQNKEKLSETDALKVRLFSLKESNVALYDEIATLREDNAKLTQDLAAKDKEIARLRRYALSFEKKADIGHLLVGPQDVIKEESNGEFFLYREPAQKGLNK